MKVISTVIRILLTLGVLCMVYKETGPWTAGALFLVALTFELNSIARKLIIETLQDLEKICARSFK